jgi:chloramphenicol 3-O-phosphotransferase
MLTAASMVWNRAALDNGGSRPGKGDRALAALLTLHGLVMNGGLHHALEVLSPEQVDIAAEGLIYFHLDAVARLIGKVRSESSLRERNDTSEAEANGLYAALIPDDNVIAREFERRYAESPEEFSSLGVTYKAV